MGNNTIPLRIAGVGYSVPDAVITNDDLINALPKERQDKINAEVEKTVAKWGGVRANSGRKRVTGQVLDFTKRLTEKEARFIDYTREHNIDVDDLMQG